MFASMIAIDPQGVSTGKTEQHSCFGGGIKSISDRRCAPHQRAHRSDQKAPRTEPPARTTATAQRLLRDCASCR